MKLDFSNLSHVSNDAKSEIDAGNPDGVARGESIQSLMAAAEEHEYVKAWRKGPEAHDMDALNSSEVASFLEAITNNDRASSSGSACHTTIGPRYNTLKGSTRKIEYYFALNLHQAIQVLPLLLRAILETARFLGPTQCAISIIEGRSTDGTFHIVEAYKHELEKLGVEFYLSTSGIDPKDEKQDRMEGLAFLRNMALAPLVISPDLYSPDVQIIFLNDVMICQNDILEMVYQQRKQNATMTCGMDWSSQGATFYDIYVARSIVGESFWQVAQDGLWHFSNNLFWTDRESRAKFDNHQPFQVYSCWNGGAVIAGAPIVQQKIRFRRSNVSTDECYMGEPTLFAKDLWRLGLGRIQVVPSINVVYAEETEFNVVKDLRGRVEGTINISDEALQTERVQWQALPPSLVKCMPQLHAPYWVPST